MSTPTDVDALGVEPGVHVDFAADPRLLAAADVIVLPGTRAVFAAWDWMRSRGVDTAIIEHARRGGTVLGIGEGCSLLGRTLHDPEGVAGVAGRSTAGLGLLDLETVLTPEPVLRLSTGAWQGTPVSGYENHHARIRLGRGQPFPGGLHNGPVYGTMWYGIAEHDAFRGAWLTEAAAAAGRTGGRFGQVSFAAAREARLDLLADLVEQHLDLDALLSLITEGAPRMPTLRGELQSTAEGQ